MLQDSGNDWSVYEEKLYECFRKDFIESKPAWPRKRVGLKRHPLTNGKEATFWHFIGENKLEADQLRRCERIRWPRPVMNAFPNRKSQPADQIIWWMSQRHTEARFVLALADFSYVVVVADRGDYVLPWTAYCIEQVHRRTKLRKECATYWNSRKS